MVYAIHMERTIEISHTTSSLGRLVGCHSSLDTSASFEFRRRCLPFPSQLVDLNFGFGQSSIVASFAIATCLGRPGYVCRIPNGLGRATSRCGQRYTLHVKPYKLQLATVVLSVFTLLCISTGLIYTTEHSVNPAIPDYFTALYFALTTLTTVGFGDITPVMTEGKLVVSGSILAGVAVIPVQAAALVDALLAREDVKKSSRQRETVSNNNNKNGKSTMMNNSPIMLNMKCTNCDAGFHWSAADYCWSCGSKLPDDGRV